MFGTQQNTSSICGTWRYTIGSAGFRIDDWRMSPISCLAFSCSRGMSRRTSFLKDDAFRIMISRNWRFLRNTILLDEIKNVIKRLGYFLGSVVVFNGFLSPPAQIAKSLSFEAPLGGSGFDYKEKAFSYWAIGVNTSTALPHVHVCQRET